MPEAKKLNTTKKNPKKTFTVCLSDEQDDTLCNWADSSNIVNQYGTPNRSAAIGKLIDTHARDRKFK